MRAIVYRKYGPPSVLRLEDVEKAAPRENEVSIRVRAASVNPLDWHFLRGEPYFLRLMLGLPGPKSGRLGVDVAGTVEAVGSKAARFKPGDEVFGTGRGTFAESVCARESFLAIKPANLTFEQAASSPCAGVTALQALRDKGGIQAGQKVLINGASGGVGTFAVQIARSFGAEVSGVCSGSNVGMVRSLGAARVFDYTQEDFTNSGERYDLLLDNMGNRSVSGYRGVLKPRGRYVQVGGTAPRWTGGIPDILGLKVRSLFTSQKMGAFLALPSQEGIETLAGLMESRKVTPVIDRTCPLEDLPEAVRYLEQGHARGKVVIAVESPRVV